MNTGSEARLSFVSLASSAHQPASAIVGRAISGSSAEHVGAADTRSHSVRSARKPGAPPRQRPLIYVYEMPQAVTTDLLQRRHDKLFCTHRTYLRQNVTQYAFGIYQGYVLELILHEWLLSSPHRTLDPTEADWFYVPVYASCAVVTAIFQGPRSVRVKYRLALAQQLYMQALDHVRTRYPFWNSSGGADHIWTFGYDEGACFAPAALGRSVLISHWGNMLTKHNRCTTTYDADRWDVASDPYSHLPLHSLAGHTHCYDSEKDIVMPSFKELATFLPTQQARRGRSLLFFFSGDLGSPAGSVHAGPHVHPNYSMGIRQAVYRAVQAANASDIRVAGHFPRDWWHVQYHRHLRDSTFCGAFPGDGWSGGISSAVFAGCVPVIVMDGILLPFENVLNYSAFSIRIAEADIPELPRILQSVPRERIAELQVNLHRVRARFGYASLATNEQRLSLSSKPNDPALGDLAKLSASSEQEEDALQTVMRVLLYRAARRSAGTVVHR